jgi:hypothetical protein
LQKTVAALSRTRKITKQQMTKISQMTQLHNNNVVIKDFTESPETA